MANFDRGVSGYMYGVCKVKNSFPVDAKGSIDLNCYQCNFFSRTTGICQLTKQVSEYPSKYIGSHCPFIFDGEIIEKDGGNNGHQVQGNNG